MYIDNGTYIIGFSVSKGHISVSPEQAAMREFESEIEESGYTQTKNLFRIKWNDEVNYELIGKMIEKQRHDKEGYTRFWKD